MRPLCLHRSYVSPPGWELESFKDTETISDYVWLVHDLLGLDNLIVLNLLRIILIPYKDAVKNCIKK